MNKFSAFMTAMTPMIFYVSITFLLSAHPAPAFAADAQMRIDGDLMIHPNQMANFFELGARKIKASTTWDWPSVQSTKPYKTQWTNLRAKGPFDIQFGTLNLANQEFSFDLTWANPEIEVGTFEIHDTIVRDSGGNHFIFHLDGQCTGMDLKIAGGAWKVHGKMKWNLVAGHFVVAWESFAFQTNPAATTSVDSGQCQGQPDLIRALHDAVTTVSQDRAWLSDIIKSGAEEWATSNLESLQTEMLKSRQVQVNPRVTAAWEPSALSMLSGGLIRVAGQIVIAKPGSPHGNESVTRDYDPATTLTQVKESGFVLPTTTLQKIAGYMFSNRELHLRAKSTQIPAFVNLMQNPFIQFFVWPDLLAFTERTLFYFDLSPAEAPQLTHGEMLDGGGSRYDLDTAIVVNQWAPGKRSYVPYADFRSVISGQVSAKISGETLSVQMNFDDLDVDVDFRPEYLKVRSVNNWIANSVLGSHVKDYLNSTLITQAVPSWQLGPGLSLNMRDLQAWKDSFRIPLDFKSKAP